MKDKVKWTNFFYTFQLQKRTKNGIFFFLLNECEEMPDQIYLSNSMYYETRRFNAASKESPIISILSSNRVIEFTTISSRS